MLRASRKIRHQIEYACDGCGIVFERGWKPGTLGSFDLCARLWMSGWVRIPDPAEGGDHDLHFCRACVWTKFEDAVKQGER